MENTIIAYLKKKYQPNAIILHGSRARGREREHSDWDLVFLYNSTPQHQNGRELFEGQNIEFSVHTLPVEDIYGEFTNKLQVATVLYEENNEGTDLLRKATDFYDLGVHWSTNKLSDHEIWMQGRIGGMQDNLNNPMLFAKYHADFYQRVFNYWYWIVQHTHSQPLYIACEEVADKDPEYFELVKGFMSPDTSPSEKVEMAEKISFCLFKDKF